MTNGNASQYRGIGVDGDMILNDGVAWHVEHIALFVVFETLSTERHSLIKGDVVADDSGFADDYTCSMVNGKVFTDGGSGVNVNTGLRVSLLGDDTRDDGYFQLM